MPHKKFIFGLIVFLAFTRMGNAAEDLPSLFQKYFNSSEISMRHCGQNITGFVKYAAQSGVSPKEIAVVQIKAPFHPWSFGRIVAVDSRWGDPIPQGFHQNWDFHYIAIYKKQVYDFSFHKTPLLLSVVDYLNQMYVPKVPFAINGDSFRVGNEGPYYASEHALRELEHFEFIIYSVNTQQQLTAQSKKLKLQDFLTAIEM